MKIIIRLTAIFFAFLFAYIADIFGESTEPEHTNIYSFMFFLVLGFLSQAGLLLASIAYENINRIMANLLKVSSAILMLPALLLFLSLVSSVEGFVNTYFTKNTQSISALAYAWGVIIYVFAYIRLFLVKSGSGKQYNKLLKAPASQAGTPQSGAP